MKLIRTIIRSANIDDVREALGALNIGRLSLVELEDRPGNRAAIQAGADRRRFTPRSDVLVELVVEDHTVAPALQQIARSLDRHPAANRVVVVPLE